MRVGVMSESNLQQYSTASVFEPTRHPFRKKEELHAMFKKCLVVLVPVLAGVLALTTPVRAQNLLVNPGFETGNLAGWTDGGNTGWNNVTTNNPHSGTFNIDNGAVGSLSLLSQTIA